MEPPALVACDRGRWVRKLYSRPDLLATDQQRAGALHEQEPDGHRGPRYLRFAREQPGLYAILFQTEVPNPAPRFSEDELRDRPGHEVFELVLGAVARCVDDETTAFDTACLAWMALHGRVAMQAAMPSFPFPDDERFVALLIDGCVG